MRDASDIAAERLLLNRFRGEGGDIANHTTPCALDRLAGMGSWCPRETYNLPIEHRAQELRDREADRIARTNQEQSPNRDVDD